ncbi:rCG28937 [Rattus norvegicus]|uniref:RCG28937 n=1 Tax=Rattus norvegicus TaxID=10116 RepID=A6HWH6_RAT|nr:rCG28937 [Rattus norvegicus]
MFFNVIVSLGENLSNTIHGTCTSYVSYVLYLLILVSIKFLFGVCVCVCVCVCKTTFRSEFSPSTLWVTGVTQFSLSGLGTRSFTC